MPDPIKEVSWYIHLNPVKAMMVREPLDYKYSSYYYFLPMEGSKDTKIKNIISNIVTTDRVLNLFANNKREQYRMFVEGKMSHASTIGDLADSVMKVFGETEKKIMATDYVKEELEGRPHVVEA